MINFLVFLCLLVLVLYVVNLVMGMIPLPEPLRNIVMIIIGLIAVISIVQRLGFLGLNLGLGF